MAGRDPRGQLDRDAPGRQRAGQGEVGRLHYVRRPLLLRRVRVLRPRPGEDPRPVRRPRRHLRGDRLRRHRARHPQRRPHRRPLPRDPARGPVRRGDQRRHRQRGLLARLLLGLRGEDHERRLGAGDPRPVLVAALRRGRPAELGDHAVPQLPAGVPLPALLDAAAARQQLLRLPRQHPHRPRRPPLGRPPRRRPVPLGQAGGPAARRPRHAARRRADRRHRRHRRQVGPEPRPRVRRDDQPRLLASRVGRGADRRERALRAPVPGEAAVLPRGHGAVRDADPGGLHARDHLAALGRARDRQESAPPPTPPSSPTTAAAAAPSSPVPTRRRSPTRTSPRAWPWCACAATSAPRS